MFSARLLLLVTTALSILTPSLAGCCPTATGYCCVEPCACDFALSSEAMGCDPCAKSSMCYDAELCGLVRGDAPPLSREDSPLDAWLSVHGNLDACCGCDCHCAECGGACPPCFVAAGGEDAESA
jgi:hypothetical protein